MAICFPVYCHLLEIDSLDTVRFRVVVNATLDIIIRLDLWSRWSCIAKLGFAEQTIAVGLDADLGWPNHRITAFDLATVFVSCLSLALASDTHRDRLLYFIDDWNHRNLDIRRRMPNSTICRRAWNQHDSSLG